jgi:hypothetical protein
LTFLYKYFWRQGGQFSPGDRGIVIVSRIFPVFTFLEVAAVIGGALGRDSPYLQLDLLNGIRELDLCFIDVSILKYF